MDEVPFPELYRTIRLTGREIQALLDLIETQTGGRFAPTSEAMAPVVAELVAARDYDREASR